MARPWRRLRAELAFSGRGREAVVQAAKMAVAAVVAWSVARLFDETQSFIAAYSAVFMMSGTVYRSLCDAARQVGTVVLGVLVAFGAAALTPWPTAELAVAVFAGMVVGRWHRLGRDGIWVGVIALLMVTYGAAGDPAFLALRVAEVLFGATVGAVVNALVMPPLYLRQAGDAVARLSGEIAELLDSMAEGLAGDWDEYDARRWRTVARQLEAAVRNAEEAVGEGRESMLFNLRSVWSRETRPVVQGEALSTLYEVAEQLRQLTQTLVTAEEPDNEVPETGRVFNESLAELLTVLAGAVRAHHARDLDRETLTAALDRARARRAALARLGPWPAPEVPDQDPPKDWSSHAAAVLAAERALRALLDAPG